MKARFVAYNPPKKIPITNVLGDTEDEECPGYAEFQLHGRTYRLEPVMEGPAELFFMFRDETSRTETYGSGRFLNTPLAQNGELAIDFNHAHNPPCVKVLDRKLSFARIGRIWPYVGDAHHPVIVYDYTPTRARAGPAKFLEGYKGYLQADAYSVYDAFFKPERGMTEVGCWMHARRYVFKALESDEPHMGPALHLIARLYAVEERAKALSLSAEQRLALRQRVSARLIGKLHQYLLELQPEVLPKSPSGAAVRYALNQWEALTRFLGDGELEIDNGGKTAAVLRSFVASCKRCGVEPFAWFNDVLSRIPAHSIARLTELLPQTGNLRLLLLRFDNSRWEGAAALGPPPLASSSVVRALCGQVGMLCYQIAQRGLNDQDLYVPGRRADSSATTPVNSYRPVEC